MIRIDTLLCNITVRSRIMNLQMKSMCQPTFGPYSRINIKLPDLQLQYKSSLGQDAKLSLPLINMIKSNK